MVFAIAVGCIAHRARAENPLPEVERLKTSPVLRHLKPNPVAQPPTTQAAQTVAQMYVPDGFRVAVPLPWRRSRTRPRRGHPPGRTCELHPPHRTKGDPITR